jgi:regulatory protein
MKQSAYQYALYLLSAQDYSEFKLRQKLRLKQFEQTEIDETLTKLIEKNYLREEEYKRLLARRWIAKGYSDSMIKRRGEQEQLSFTSEELLNCRQEMDRSSEDTISLLVQKKMRGRDLPIDREGKQKLREKVSRFLLSKGYGWDDVRKAVDEALKTN